MLNLRKITSNENELIKKIVKLGISAPFRRENSLAVIYGFHLIAEATNFDIVDTILISEVKLEKYIELVKIHADKIVIVPQNLMHKINVFDSELEIMAIISCKYQSMMTSDIYQQDCLILEHLQDPGNLGTILRSAVASGINNVLLSKNCVDLYNPKVLRASQGIQFNLNVFQDCDLTEFIEKYSGQVIALDISANDSIYQQNLLATTALAFGNEGNGLTQNLLDKIHLHAKIPMHQNCESLNLAVAASISMFELNRQRLLGGGGT